MNQLTQRGKIYKPMSLSGSETSETRNIESLIVLYIQHVRSAGYFDNTEYNISRCNAINHESGPIPASGA